jgi:hypothetical protein
VRDPAVEDPALTDPALADAACTDPARATRTPPFTVPLPRIRSMFAFPAARSLARAVCRAAVRVIALALVASAAQPSGAGTPPAVGR